jgi:1-acyl-sn-glycerol-3-phosphate acyltransferase
MMRILSYILTPFFIFVFVGILLVFHPLLVIAWYTGGYKLHRRVLLAMNICIINALRMIGTRFIVKIDQELPTEEPLIIVSNHQSMYDIPLMMIHLYKQHPLFIAKTELAKGIPSISFSLRHMGSALINRGDAKQAILTIKNFAQNVFNKRYTACIFPEGTRAKDGNMKKFKPAGLLALLQEMPNTKVVPVVITGAWHLLKHKFWPVPCGIKVHMHVLAAIERDNYSNDEICKTIEECITKKVSSLPN